MTMYYHMYGPSIGKLQVFTRKEVYGRISFLWSRTRDIGNYFARARIQLPASSDAVQVRLPVSQPSGLVSYNL